MRLLTGLLLFLSLPVAAAFTASPASPASPVEQTTAEVNAGPQIRLESTELDLGDIEKDSVGTGSVRFFNDGTKPLVITSVFTDCNCTVTSYTKDPVAPGDSGVIQVKFSTKGRAIGSFRKVARIRSNTGHTTLLFIKGIVKRPYRK